MAMKWMRRAAAGLTSLVALAVLSTSGISLAEQREARLSIVPMSEKPLQLATCTFNDYQGCVDQQMRGCPYPPTEQCSEKARAYCRQNVCGK